MFSSYKKCLQQKLRLKNLFLEYKAKCWLISEPASFADDCAKVMLDYRSSTSLWQSSWMPFYCNSTDNLHSFQFNNEQVIKKNALGSSGRINFIWNPTCDASDDDRKCYQSEQLNLENIGVDQLYYNASLYYSIFDSNSKRDYQLSKKKYKKNSSVD